MGSPLVDVAALSAAMLTGRPPVLLDVRWQLGGPPGLSEYRLGHLLGSAFVDLDAELAGPPGIRGRHPLPDVTVLQASLRRAGVTASRPVVVYDGGSGMGAARAWWVLRWAGHPEVSVLDGGLPAWRDAGRPLAAGDGPPPAEGDFTVLPGSMPTLDADGAATLARAGVLVDVRAGERYRGEQEPIDSVAGHIPGAVNAPVTELYEPSGRLLPEPVLAARFAELLGEGRDRGPVGASCGSGVSAAQLVLALEVCGIPAALYVGSWSEWITDPTRSVATGPDPG
ncbi:MAG TPA: sulfurtransferase [Actinomycetes bacterium]